MDVRLLMTILLCSTEVDEEKGILDFPSSRNDVVRLDVTVDEVS